MNLPVDVDQIAHEIDALTGQLDPDDFKSLTRTEFASIVVVSSVLALAQFVSNDDVPWSLFGENTEARHDLARSFENAAEAIASKQLGDAPTTE